MQQEQIEFKRQIHKIQDENNELNFKLDAYKNSTCNGETLDDATREKLTNDAVKNVMIQIEYLQAENKDLKLLNKNCNKTIENLEKEIQDYRNQIFNPTSACEVKQKYATALKLLEGTIVSQQKEIKEQKEMINNLFEQKRHLKAHIESLEKSIEEKLHSKFDDSVEQVHKLQKQLTEYTQQNKELEKSLKAAKLSIEDRFKREQIALQKVQDALAIAEGAVADKEEALKREKIVKEECDNIASTIGQVMDEAARKVDKDMEEIRKKYLEKERQLIKEKTKMREEILNQTKLYQILNNRCNRFEQNYKDALKDNERLTKQLELVAKTISEMEHKLLQQESNYNNNNKLGRYRMTIQELAKSFEEQIHRLQTEMANLRAENKILKSQRHCNKT
ncbi:centrosomal protein of 83 kDa-like [Musca vetustissima]|uniref:centrosomal protein of 83 kDa-like n=1 Tax=Musca vetustissima TaxID=27455 RepID=UPI002AB772C6|nr:centrosomal protein of 83 kDa-like [Musca vetustissima]